MKYLFIITFFALLSVNAIGINFEKATIKEYATSTYIWVLITESDSKAENNIVEIRKENLTLTGEYSKGGKKTVIVYVNDVKAIPPQINNEKHAETIVIRSLTSNIMKLYIVAFCETKEKTSDIVFKPVEYLQNRVKHDQEESTQKTE